MRQMRLHTEAFEHDKSIYTETLWHTHAFTHRSFYTSEHHRSFDTEKPLHKEHSTHRSFYTQKIVHRSLYTEMLLRTGAFTHKRLHTQKLVHTETFTHRSSYTEQLLHASKSQIYCVFDVRPSCHAKGLHLTLWRWTIILRQRVAPHFGTS